MHAGVSFEDVIPLSEHFLQHRRKLEHTSKSMQRVLQTIPDTVVLNRKNWQSMTSDRTRTDNPIQFVLERLLRRSASGLIKTLKLEDMKVYNADGRFAPPYFLGTEPEFCTALSQSTALTKLSLAGNWIGPDGAFSIDQALRNCTTLKSLDLFSTCFGDVGAYLICGTLRRNSALQKLRLSVETSAVNRPSNDAPNHPRYSRITGNGISFIAQALLSCEGLTSLTLCYNDMPDTGSLAATLPLLTALTHLDLSSNDIGRAGGIALGPALGLCTTLKSFNFANNSMDNDGMKSIANGLSIGPSLVELNLSCVCPRSADPMLFVIMLTQKGHALKKLDLSNDFDVIKFTVDMGNALSACPLLTHLDLTQITMDDESVVGLEAGLANCGDLIHLVLYNCGALSWTMARAISQCTALVHLDLSENGIDPTHIEYMRIVLQNCIHLKNLKLRHNDAINDAFALELFNIIQTYSVGVLEVDLTQTEDNGTITEPVQALLLNPPPGRRWRYYSD